MASIRDVAIKAGVGIGTVSRALNGSGYISDETKQKIMQAVETAQAAQAVPAQEAQEETPHLHPVQKQVTQVSQQKSRKQ